MPDKTPQNGIIPIVGKKNILDVLPIATLILIYLYVCGGLYLISFWSTFDIDVSNFASVSEIPKSFIYPFLIANTIFLAQLGIHIIGYHMEKAVTGQPAILDKPILRTNKFSWINELDPYVRDLIVMGIAFFIIVFVGVLYYFFSDYMFFWVIALIIFVLPVVSLMQQISVIKKFSNEFSLRLYMIMLILIVPFVCVLDGKYNSLNIHNNSLISTRRFCQKIVSLKKTYLLIHWV